MVDEYSKDPLKEFLREIRKPKYNPVSNAVIDARVCELEKARAELISDSYRFLGEYFNSSESDSFFQDLFVGTLEEARDLNESYFERPESRKKEKLNMTRSRLEQLASIAELRKGHSSSVLLMVAEGISPKTEDHSIEDLVKGANYENHQIINLTQKAIIDIDNQSPFYDARQELRRNFKKYCQIKDKLVFPNVRLVNKISLEYTSIPELHIIQQGMLGLLKSIDNYERGKGTNLMSYAGHWIRDQILKYYQDLSRTVRLPRSYQKKRRDVLRKMDSLEKELGKVPTRQEVAEALGKPIGWVDDAFLGDRIHISLNERKTGFKGTYADIIPDSNTSPLSLQLSNPDYMRVLVWESLRVLTDKERVIVAENFGLNGNKKTYAELGKDLGISGERVRQIKKTALEKLKNSKKAREALNYQDDFQKLYK